MDGVLIGLKVDCIVRAAVWYEDHGERVDVEFVDALLVNGMLPSPIRRVMPSSLQVYKLAGYLGKDVAVLA